jgi:membrane protease YdiL (CAAX protease family)
MNHRAVRVVAFAAVAYGLAWSWWLPIAAKHQVVVIGGWPTHLPGLLAPAVAAVVVTAFWYGRSGLQALAARVLRWRIGWWWLVALSPLGLLAATIGVQSIVGGGPANFADYWHINGFPVSWGLAGTLMLLLFINALGEETGWRGFLQTELQRHLRPRWAILIVAGIWAGWHAPLFAILSSYRGFTLGTMVGFVIGLASGAVVLGWLYNRTGSVLAVAVWHATYNLCAATPAAGGLLAAVSTTLVIAGAVALVATDIVKHGRILEPCADAGAAPVAWSRPGPRPVAMAARHP